MSVKKNPAGRRAVQADVEDAGAPQSAAERRAAEAELSLLIDQYAAAHRRLVGAVRKSLQKRLPTAYEVIYEYRDFFVISFSPNDRGYDGVLGLHAGAGGVRLYFNRGKELPDPAKLLQGSAKQVRFIDLETASTLARPEVALLLDQAIAQNREPFAAASRGAIVIRPTSAKKRRQ